MHNLYSYKTDQWPIIALRYHITRWQPVNVHVVRDDTSCQTFPDLWNVGHVIDTDCCYGNVWLVCT